jgi:hypothetical protein
MRAVLIVLVLSIPMIAVADEVPVPDVAPEAEPAPPPPAPTPVAKPPTTPAPTATNTAPPGATAPNIRPVDVVVKAAKRPGSVLYIPEPTQGVFAERPKISYTPAIIGTSATGALLVLSALSFVKYEKVQGSTGREYASEVTVEELDRRLFESDRTKSRWKHIWLGTMAATLASAGTTAYLWSRHDRFTPTVDIDPTNSAASFSIVIKNGGR